MRVYLTADVVGGVWDYTATLASGLCEAGHEVRVAVLGSPDRDRLSLLPGSAEVVAADYRLEWMPDAADDVRRAGEWLAADARAWGADIVHLNQMSYAVNDFGVPTVVAIHSDVLSWFSETRGMAAPAEWDDYAGSVRAGLAAATMVVTPSRYQSELTRLHLGRGADRVIHNGARPAPHTRPPSGPPVSARQPVVVSVGRTWDEAKGMGVLDDAIGLLACEALDVHVLGATAGPNGERFAAKHVRTHGPVPRSTVEGWLSRASVYVGASRYEPFGLAPLEAAMHRTALVLSDIGSFRELWDGCAEFFPGGNAAALADVLRDLARDPDRRDRLAEAARQRALDAFTADRFTAAYLDLYELPQPCV